MIRKLFLCFSLILLFPFIQNYGYAKSPLVDVLRVDGIIDPVTAEYISQGITNAADAGATCLIIEMDTPGGLDLSMRKICQAILNAPIPVAVYVYPTGARAASAGVFITMSAQIAAMAPGTNIGAAHPVDQNGNKLSDKVENDAAAYARTIAVQHARNAEWAEEAVRKSVSLTDQEALKQNVVTLSAKDLDDLLKQINGQKITLPHSEVTLDTKNAEIQIISMSLRQSILHTLANPNIAYIFMMLGMLGLIYEITNPHGMSGIAGVICILLALVSLEALPFNLAGFLLIVLAVILFFVDIKAPTHGVLTLGGMIALIFGSMLIFSPQGTPQEPYISARVSWFTIITMTLLTAGFFTFIVAKGLQAMKRPAALGTHLLSGAIGIATTNLQPDGIVHVQGEEWKAVTDSINSINKGDKVRVTKIDGLTLYVEKA